jgi:hypothetical protein
MTTPAPHVLYLNGLSVTENKLSGLAAPVADGHAANKKYVDDSVAATAAAAAAAVTSLVDSAPAALNTLKELATALGDDASFATTVTNSLAAKATILSLTTETDRAIAAEGVLRGDLAAELIVARAAEKVLRDDLAAELVVARAAEGVLRDDLAAELVVARAAEKVLRDDLAAELVVARAAEGVLRTDLATLDGQHDALQVLHTALRTEHNTLKGQHDALQALHNTLRTEHNALASSTPSTTSFGKVTEYIEALHNYFFENADAENLKAKPTLPTYDNSN